MPYGAKVKHFTHINNICGGISTADASNHKTCGAGRKYCSVIHRTVTSLSAHWQPRRLPSRKAIEHIQCKTCMFLNSKDTALLVLEMWGIEQFIPGLLKVFFLFFLYLTSQNDWPTEVCLGHWSLIISFLLNFRCLVSITVKIAHRKEANIEPRTYTEPEIHRCYATTLWVWLQYTRKTCLHFL